MKHTMPSAGDLKLPPPVLVEYLGEEGTFASLDSLQRAAARDVEQRMATAHLRPLTLPEAHLQETHAVGGAGM